MYTNISLLCVPQRISLANLKLQDIVPMLTLRVQSIQHIILILLGFNCNHFFSAKDKLWAVAVNFGS